jgi:hypothetical protein
VPPVPPPTVVEGAIPFAEVTGTGLEFTPPPETAEGSTVFIDEL